MRTVCNIAKFCSCQINICVISILAISAKNNIGNENSMYFELLIETFTQQKYYVGDIYFNNHITYGVEND